MDKKTFWEIINNVNATVNCSDQAAVLLATEKKLMEHSANDIADWHQIMSAYMDIAYRHELWAACAATVSHSSDDGFIDFRSWLISQGKEIYMAALHNPDSLADLDILAGTANFELYGYVAYDAYAQKKALESTDFKSILHKCCCFTAANAARIFDMCERHPMPNMDKYQRLTNAYIQTLAKQYDVCAVIASQPISPEIIADIKAEIALKPDISSGWRYDDLPQIVPRLYQKYNEAAEQPGIKLY